MAEQGKFSEYSGSHFFVTLDDSLLPSPLEDFNNVSSYHKSKPRDMPRNIIKALFDLTENDTPHRPGQWKTEKEILDQDLERVLGCLLYTSPSPRDA